MELDALRTQLDSVDSQIVALFEKRMALALAIGQYKLDRAMPVLDKEREARVLKSRAEMCQNPALKQDVQALFECLMALSRQKQALLHTKEV